ncbi:serine/threonine protein kinase [Streptomyces sp. TRM66268-LWL]|uniref:Serine/threonine protein kinase n=1 Tax=Streptomyces polyasparticus TaxID=2767826 RepID=A0ABR7ST92_9ACTN|nr:serine/threonine-protein kinase [Streptomyces polyasparticus]MBC9718623.1 serine/threonine protein kinase [Streptomyces polyasparticus]
MQPLEAGEPTTIGPYRLLGRLGAGGMGRVYLGRSAGGRTVAVKVVHPHFALDEEFRARFRREVEAARRVGAAWTAPVLDADADASVPWVATGYVAGPSLSEAVGERGALRVLPDHSVRVLGAGLGEALAAVHALGLVHRDVKPSNVLLALDGPRLIDFGIARATDGTASLTSTGVSIGSPGYMAPEQILGKGVTGASDVFSLGAVLAYAATGSAPFTGDSSAALLYQVVHTEPEVALPGGDLREVILDCLAKEPSARPAPAEVARRLAPGGAAGLVAAGWLPGPLVEQVSRSAVRLLDLEPSPAPEASGPVPFSKPGVFGPPDPTYGAPAVHASEEPADRQPAAAETAPPPGKLSVSVSAATTQGDNGRGRKVSCTLALAVASAVAAVTLGSVLVFNMLPDNNGDNDGGAGGKQSSRPPAATQSSSPSAEPSTPDGALSEIPERYLGTWQGKAQALGGLLPAGTVEVKVKQADVGKQLGTASMTDELGASTCTDILILQSVTDKELIAVGKAKNKKDARCTKNDHIVRLTPVGDDLQYSSENPDGGDPSARLSKVG